MVADTVFHTCDIEYSLVPGNDSIELGGVSRTYTHDQAHRYCIETLGVT